MRISGKIVTTAVLLAFTFCGCGSGWAAGEDTKAQGADRQVAAMDITKVTVSDNIHINQIGYRTNDLKQAIVKGGTGSFAVVESSTGRQVFKGALKKGPSDAASGDKISYGDFSGLKANGEYSIYIPGLGKSYPFKIADGVYGPVRDALLKGLYYQRCGIPLDAKYAGDWARADACHTDKGIVYGSTDKLMDGSGGWHDAGDYGKYTVAGTTAVADLLLAWELFPESFKGTVNIPESSDKTPDILNECRYELEWLLKMQDPGSGGVYHKLTSQAFPSLNTLAESDFGKLYFSPISATATGDFAAAAAMAARLYQPYDSGFAARCLTGAKKAWTWLEANRSVPGFKNPPEISTGEYGDYNDSDERLWAAAELYRTTGEAAYAAYIKTAYKGRIEGVSFGWQNVSGFAQAAYILTSEKKRDTAVYSYMKNNLIKLVDSKVRRSKSDGYHTTLAVSDYGWGSNMNVMDDAMLMVFANRLTPKKDYLAAAQSNFNYLLGCNALSQCFVTGLGSKQVKDPHHRPSKADSVELPVPGLVAGGPDKSLEDDIARAKLKGQPAARCYIDNSGSYSTNEIAIYWNTPAVFVAASLSK